MAPDSRREQGRLVAMWLPRNAPSDFVADLSREPAPPQPEGDGGGDYLSPGLSAKIFWMLLEAPTILKFEVRHDLELVASYPDSPGGTINLNENLVHVNWAVVSNPLAIGPLQVDFTWVSLTDGGHEYHDVPPSSTIDIEPTDLATLGLYAWHGPQFAQYQATAELALRVNKGTPPPRNGPPKPPPTVKYSKVEVTNGNAEGHDMEIWLWDDTTGGPWQDIGPAFADSTPVDVSLPMSGHDYEVTVTDPNLIFCTAGNDPSDRDCRAGGTFISLLADPSGQTLILDVY